MLGNIVDVESLLLQNNNNNNTNIKVLEAADVQTFKDSLLLNMDAYQHPLQKLVGAFRYTKSDGTEDIDWDRAYKYLVKNHSYIRITEVVKAKDFEGLAKHLIDFITYQDTNFYKDSKGNDREWKALTKLEKLKRINRVKRKLLPKLESFEDLKKLTKDALINFDNSTYKIDLEKFDPSTFEFITPTLKEIKIKSAEDLKELWLKGVLENKLAIGYTYLNDIMSATELA